MSDNLTPDASDVASSGLPCRCSDYTFDLREMVWIRKRDGAYIKTLSDIATVTSDAEFEQWVAMMRVSRGLSHITKEQSFCLSTIAGVELFEKILVGLFFRFFLGFDLLMRFFEAVLKSLSVSGYSKYLEYMRIGRFQSSIRREREGGHVHACE